MEFVSGQTLADILGQGRLPFDRVLWYGGEIAEALSHAHERGVLHKDLKPANVMVTAAEHIKVVDFGIARTLDRSSVQALTNAGAESADTLAGTVAYMAPEVLRGQRADARSDIWALGVVLHQMAAGVLPFEGHTEFELASQNPRGPPPAFPGRTSRELRGNRRPLSRAGLRGALPDRGRGARRVGRLARFVLRCGASARVDPARGTGHRRGEFAAHGAARRSGTRHHGRARRGRGRGLVGQGAASGACPGCRTGPGRAALRHGRADCRRSAPRHRDRRQRHVATGESSVAPRQADRSHHGLRKAQRRSRPHD